MGPRFSIRSRVVHSEARRKRRGRRGANYQTRFRVSVRARHRQAALSHRVSQISGKYDSWRSCGFRAASSDQACALRTPTSHRRDADQPDARSSPMGRRAISKIPQRRAICSLQLGKGYGIFSGFDGGAEWGGPAVDPETATIYINSNEMAWMAALAENTNSS